MFAIENAPTKCIRFELKWKWLKKLDYIFTGTDNSVYTIARSIRNGVIRFVVLFFQRSTTVRNVCEVLRRFVDSLVYLRFLKVVIVFFYNREHDETYRTIWYVRMKLISKRTQKSVLPLPNAGASLDSLPIRKKKKWYRKELNGTSDSHDLVFLISATIHPQSAIALSILKQSRVPSFLQIDSYCLV